MILYYVIIFQNKYFYNINIVGICIPFIQYIIDIQYID